MAVEFDPHRNVSHAIDPASARPLCVDLDRTLIPTNISTELLLLLVKRNPLYLFAALLWLVRGRAMFAAKVAAHVTLNPGALPYDLCLLGWLESERLSGRALWLCTECSSRIGTHIADHLGLFEGVISSARDTESGESTYQSRATVLVDRFGERGFDYCGSSRLDITPWRHAHGAIAVRCSSHLRRRVARHTPLLHTLPARNAALRALLRAVRPEQWTKNVLIFVPALAAHRINELGLASGALLAAIAFCLCASSVYVLNDLLDLAADRAHPRKSKRPFASGVLPLDYGLVLAPVLAVLAFSIAAILPTDFLIALAVYYALTAVYSFALKRFVLLDTTALAALYTIRVVAGAAATNVPLSFWLSLLSVFLFLSLAFVKRVAELNSLRQRQCLQAAGRGYDIYDIPTLQNLGITSGYMSVLVLALYINSPDIEILYRRPKVIWMLCLLIIYWIGYIWTKAQRGQMHDDPLVFALKDRTSITVCLLAITTILIAI